MTWFHFFSWIVELVNPFALYFFGLTIWFPVLVPFPFLVILSLVMPFGFQGCCHFHFGHFWKSIDHLLISVLLWLDFIIFLRLVELVNLFALYFLGLTFWFSGMVPFPFWSFEFELCQGHFGWSMSLVKLWQGMFVSALASQFGVTFQTNEG